MKGMTSKVGKLRQVARLAAVSMPLLFSMVEYSWAQTNDPADEGMLTFNSMCGTCHTIRPNDNRLGPTLSGIIGRVSGRASGFRAYSHAMKAGNVTWDEATLNAFIADPDAVVSGNGMKPFAPIGDAAARSAIIKFIRSCDQCGPSCPAPKKCKSRQ